MNYKTQKVLSKDAISYRNRDAKGRECSVCNKHFNPGNLNTYLVSISEPDNTSTFSDKTQYESTDNKCEWVCSEKCSTFWILQKI